jgi:hypothetical protein
VQVAKLRRRAIDLFGDVLAAPQKIVVVGRTFSAAASLAAADALLWDMGDLGWLTRSMLLDFLKTPQ